MGVIMLSHYSKGQSETVSASKKGIIPGTIQTFSNRTFISCSFHRDIKGTRILNLNLRFTTECLITVKVTKNNKKYDLSKNSWFVLAASGSYRKGVLAYHGNGGHSRSDLPFIFKKSSIVPDHNYRPPVRSTQSTTTVTTIKTDFSTIFPIFGTKDTTTKKPTTSPAKGSAVTCTFSHTFIIFIVLVIRYYWTFWNK